MNPTFRVKCKIDGEEHTIDVTTHGNRLAAPNPLAVQTKAQALAYVLSIAQMHKIDDGEGGFYHCSHIDGAGDEHFITDICEDVDAVEIVTPEKQSRLIAVGTAAEVAAFVRAHNASAKAQANAVAAAAGVSPSAVTIPPGVK